jgi:hypothetical protein
VQRDLPGGRAHTVTIRNKSQYDKSANGIHSVSMVTYLYSIMINSLTESQKRGYTSVYGEETPKVSPIVCASSST